MLSRKNKNKFVYVTVFCTGAVSLVIEIIGTRIIAPIFGSTIYVWSSLIVTTMGALAVGYYVGGYLADKYKKTEFLFNVIFVAGVVTLAIPKIANPVLLFANGLGLKFGPLLAATVIFFIPLLLLGMVTPFVIKIEAGEIKNIGKEAGKIFSLATFGSLVGGLLSGFFLAPIVPSDLLIAFSGLLLILLYIIWQLI